MGPSKSITSKLWSPNPGDDDFGRSASVDSLRSEKEGEREKGKSGKGELEGTSV